MPSDRAADNASLIIREAVTGISMPEDESLAIEERRMFGEARLWRTMRQVDL